jgi:hypothetical protein
MSRKRADWSRSLPRPIKIPDVMTIATLADARALMSHLPKGHVERQTWRHVAQALAEAAGGADIADTALALRLALSIEGVPCRLL